MGNVDPRAVRTDDALRSALHTLARQRPVEELTVQDVCKVAEVSRATFYRRNQTPAAMLAEEFALLQAEVQAAFLDEATATGRELQQLHEKSLRELTAHIAEYVDVYRNSLRMEHSVLRVLLQRHMSNSIEGYLDVRRDDLVLPVVLRDQPWHLTRDLLAQHYADSELSVVSVWLSLEPEERDRADLAGWMLAMAPAWDRRLMDLGGGRSS